MRERERAPLFWVTSQIELLTAWFGPGQTQGLGTQVLLVSRKLASGVQGATAQTQAQAMDAPQAASLTAGPDTFSWDFTLEAISSLKVHQP